MSPVSPTRLYITCLLQRSATATDNMEDIMGMATSRNEL